MQSAKSFDARLQRIFEATGTGSDSSLAKTLGIKPPSVTAARKRGQIPSGWIEQIADKFNVSSDWLFFGKGSMKGTLPLKPEAAQELGACPRCAELEQDLRIERDERRELARENRRLLQENGDLRVELVEARARAAPGEESEGVQSDKDAA